MSHADDVSSLSPSISTPETTASDLAVLLGQLQAAEALQQQTRRLFTHAPSPMLLLTLAGRIVDANLKAEALIGWPLDRMIGRRLTAVLAPTSHSVLTTLLKAVFSQPGAHQAELVLTTPDGVVRTIIVDVERDLGAGDEDANPWAHLVVTDVTGLKEAHAQLLDHVDDLQGQLQEQLARRHRLEAEVQGIIKATQAQLNLHLARVQNLLQRHVKAAGPADDLALAQDTVNRTLALLAALDRYVQARQLRLRPGSVDLNRVLREVRNDLHDELKGRAVDWSPTPLPTVHGDSRALRMILTAYVSNALKFTRTRDVAQIRFVVEEHEHEVLIGVQDNGVGFSNRVKDKAFDLFGRLHKTSAFEGAGVDLAMVKQLCELSGGRAWAEGKVDQGATFWFSCPRLPCTTD